MRLLIALGWSWEVRSHYGEAHCWFEDHLKLDTRIQFWDGIAEGWRDLGNLYNDQGDKEKATECYAKCRVVCQEHGLVKSVSSTG